MLIKRKITITFDIEELAQNGEHSTDEPVWWDGIRKGITHELVRGFSCSSADIQNLQFKREAG